mmetsp:Transcript_632/g.2095  ORF Transcript_632/g.2095 Transcript_632/m.2095 type:complete len:225 (+) Transcript_632:3-677(+)
MPLSIENESFGNPAMPHSRMETGSPRHATRENLALDGIPADLHAATHFCEIPSRNAIVNVPRYEIIPAAMSMSPVRFWKSSPSWCARTVQWSRCPPKPLISFSARSSFTTQSSTSSSKRFFSRMESSSCFSSAASADMIPSSSSCFTFRAAMILLYSLSAASNAIFLGTTILITRSYASMAPIQVHNPSAALAAFAAFSGVKFSSAMYFSRNLSIIRGSMLSLS